MGLYHAGISEDENQYIIVKVGGQCNVRGAGQEACFKEIIYLQNTGRAGGADCRFLRYQHIFPLFH